MTFNPISPAVASDDDRYSTTASPYPNGNSNPSTTPPLPSPSPVSHTSSVTSLVSSSVVSTPSPKPRSINSSSLIGDELATICRDARKSGRLLGRYVISKDLSKENYDL